MIEKSKYQLYGKALLQVKKEYATNAINTPENKKRAELSLQFMIECNEQLLAILHGSFIIPDAVMQDMRDSSLSPLITPDSEAGSSRISVEYYQDLAKKITSDSNIKHYHQNLLYKTGTHLLTAAVVVGLLGLYESFGKPILEQQTHEACVEQGLIDDGEDDAVTAPILSPSLLLSNVTLLSFMATFGYHALRAYDNLLEYVVNRRACRLFKSHVSQENYGLPKTHPKDHLPVDNIASWFTDPNLFFSGKKLSLAQAVQEKYQSLEKSALLYN